MEYGCKVLTRSHDLSLFGKFCEAVLPLLCSHRGLAELALTFAHTHETLFKDALLRNPYSTIRMAYAQFLAKIVAYLAQFEAQSYLDYTESDVRVGVVVCHLLFITLIVVLCSSKQVEVTEIVDTRVDDAGVTHNITETKTVRQYTYTTSTARFLQYICSVAFQDYAATQWRGFNEYFVLLHEIARIGYAQRYFLHEKHLELFLLDLYLGASSPLVDVLKRPRDPLGNKQQRPDFSQLIAVVSLLVSSCFLVLTRRARAEGLKCACDLFCAGSLLCITIHIAWRVVTIHDHVDDG